MDNTVSNTEIVGKYFRPEEFKCAGNPCLDRMSPPFLKCLMQLRDKCGFYFVINSSWRSQQQNKMVGGERNSMHLLGKAVDIVCADSRQRAIIIREALCLGLTVGVMENAIHVDNREGDPILFHYYAKYRRS